MFVVHFASSIMEARVNTNGSRTGFQATARHRGSSNNWSQKPSTNQPNTAISNVNHSTVNTVPNKNLSVVCDAIAGLNLKDYLLGIAQIVGHENLTHASRITRSRVCVYNATPTIGQTVGSWWFYSQ